MHQGQTMENQQNVSEILSVKTAITNQINGPFPGSVPPLPRKKQRRPKVPKMPKIQAQDSFRAPLDMSVHAAGHGAQFYSKMQMEAPPLPPLPLPAPLPPPPFEPQPEQQEQKLLQQEMLQVADLQQTMLQQEQELIKKERLMQQLEERLQLEEQVAQEVPQQEEIVPPPLAVVESAVVTQGDILAENNVTEVAANVAISTEPSPAELAPRNVGVHLKAGYPQQKCSPCLTLIMMYYLCPQDKCLHRGSLKWKKSLKLLIENRKPSTEIITANDVLPTYRSVS